MAIATPHASDVLLTVNLVVQLIMVPIALPSIITTRCLLTLCIPCFVFLIFIRNRGSIYLGVLCDNSLWTLLTSIPSVT